MKGLPDGLGLMADRLLAEQGHAVVLHARSEARADGTRAHSPATLRRRNVALTCQAFRRTSARQEPESELREVAKSVRAPCVHRAPNCREKGRMMAQRRVHTHPTQ